jgi:hypothetical protein
MNYEKIQFEREIIDMVRSSYILSKTGRNVGINLKEVIDLFGQYNFVIFQIC